jgi:alpha-beta hydrolase superfamily lysophospholipase
MKVVAMGAALGVTVVAAPQPANTQARYAQKPKRSGSYIETDDGTKLFYRDWGAGTPIVFCHPWALNSDIWEYQMVALSEQGLRCIAYDRRGHGRSDDPGGGYDYDTLASEPCHHH